MIPGRTDTGDWKSGRTPSLDLDSVMPGAKPADTPELATPDGLFKIGTTSGDVELPEDLPRIPHDTPGQGMPLISDMRNDDFLPLAQCHLLLLKFYNAIACHRWLDGERNEGWWKETRKLWVQHFQSIVLHDYLPRIIDCDTYRDVRHEGRRIVRRDTTERDWFPLEFAAAVGRFGHSMIRENYKPWNGRQPGQDAGVDRFMEFSYLNSGDGLARDAHRLLGLWATNWLRLFDFGATAGGGSAVAPVNSAAIDTSLASRLLSLPDCLLADRCTNSDNREFNLATKTLLRGRELGLASAQQALDAADGLIGVPLPRLTPGELFSADYRLDEKSLCQLAAATPLWYYVLKEAECPRFGNGKRLGPLGGRIVMETVHAAIAASPNSILGCEDWRPRLPCAQSGIFTMPDLILFSAEPNPLG
jgi:hypothetical protein